MLLDSKVLLLLGRDRECDIAWDVCFKRLFELSGYVEQERSCCSYIEDKMGFLYLMQKNYMTHHLEVDLLPMLSTPCPKFSSKRIYFCLS